MWPKMIFLYNFLFFKFYIVNLKSDLINECSFKLLLIKKKELYDKK